MNITTEDVLAKLGLQTRMGPRDYLLPALGVFGLGLLAGSGITLVAIPSVRKQLRDRLRHGAAKVNEVKDELEEELGDTKLSKGRKASGKAKGKANGKANGKAASLATEAKSAREARL
jgi:hypothetical protein